MPDGDGAVPVRAGRPRHPGHVDRDERDRDRAVDVLDLRVVRVEAVGRRRKPRDPAPGGVGACRRAAGEARAGRPRPARAPAATAAAARRRGFVFRSRRPGPRRRPAGSRSRRTSSAFRNFPASRMTARRRLRREADRSRRVLPEHTSPQLDDGDGAVAARGSPPAPAAAGGAAGAHGQGVTRARLRLEELHSPARRRRRRGRAGYAWSRETR